DLFVPITSTGEVRRYDVTTQTYHTFIAAGGPLVQPWLLTFGKTNPSTLAYDRCAERPAGEASPDGRTVPAHSPCPPKAACDSSKNLQNFRGGSSVNFAL